MDPKIPKQNTTNVSGVIFLISSGFNASLLAAGCFILSKIENTVIDLWR